jgi:hypothetical protein
MLATQGRQRPGGQGCDGARRCYGGGRTRAKGGGRRRDTRQSDSQKARARTAARILMGCLVIGVRRRWSKRRGGGEENDGREIEREVECERDVDNEDGGIYINLECLRCGVRGWMWRWCCLGLALLATTGAQIAVRLFRASAVETLVEGMEGGERSQQCGQCNGNGRTTRGQGGQRPKRSSEGSDLRRDVVWSGRTTARCVGSPAPRAASFAFGPLGGRER